MSRREDTSSESEEEPPTEVADVTRVGIHPGSTGRSTRKPGQQMARGPSTKGSVSFPKLVPY